MGKTSDENVGKIIFRRDNVLALKSMTKFAETVFRNINLEINKKNIDHWHRKSSDLLVTHGIRHKEFPDSRI